MAIFQKILFVSQAVTDDVDALKQALDIARSNNAGLSALIVCPEFPPEQGKYRQLYEASLVQHLEASILAARHATGISAAELPVPVDVASGSMPAVRIIRHVLGNGHDLVIKQTEHDEDDPGFKAVDMELLRKCPCALWLCRPAPARDGGLKVAVAVDPHGINGESHDLSMRLLLLGGSIAQHAGGELHVVSCWDFPFEAYLRQNVWIRMTDEEIVHAVMETQRRHRAELNRLITRSAVGRHIHIHHLRGDAAKMIPQFVADQQIGLLVMGTVARTGIPGFVIGNTAENIIRKLDCALLAVKPDGFDSPVKPC